MLLLHMLLPLSSLLHQTLGQSTEGDESEVNEVPEEAKKQIIETLNDLRRNVEPTASNMVKTEWSDEVSKTAAKWVSRCRLQSSPKEMRTSFGAICGETISTTKVTMEWKDVIGLWHYAKENFQYGVGAINPKKSFLPYTQIVSYRAHKVGCAVTYCKDNTFPFLYACHFCPGGNLEEEINTPYKKGPPCGDCPNHCEDKLCTNPCPYYDKTPNCKEMMTTFRCDSVLGKHCEAFCKCKTEIK